MGQNFSTSENLTVDINKGGRNSPAIAGRASPSPNNRSQQAHVAKGAKFAVLVIPGVGTVDKDKKKESDERFRIKLKERLAVGLHAEPDQMIVSMFHWTNILEKSHAALWNKMNAESFAGKKIRFMTMSLVYFAMAYFPKRHEDLSKLSEEGHSEVTNLYDELHAALSVEMAALGRVAGPTAPLIVVSHGLGTVIASNYIYDLQNPRSHPQRRLSAQDGVLGRVATLHLTSNVSYGSHNRNISNGTPLERGETLVLLFTLGSPLAMMSLRYEDPGNNMDRPIKVPAPQVLNHFQLRNDTTTPPGGWYNLYDIADFMSSPLKMLSEEYDHAVVEDVQVDVHSHHGKKYTAHYYYRETDSVLSAIVERAQRTYLEWMGIKPPSNALNREKNYVQTLNDLIKFRA